MGGRNEDCVIALKDWVQAERLDKKKEQFPMTDWTLEMVKDIPRQNNGSDCGMFTCKYAEYISRKAKINFSQVRPKCLSMCDSCLILFRLICLTSGVEWFTK